MYAVYNGSLLYNGVSRLSGLVGCTDKKVEKKKRVNTT